MKYFLLAIVSLGLPLAACAQTSCWGLNCEGDGGSDIPDVYDLYNQRAELDYFMARQNWSLYSALPFETREECMQRCEDDSRDWASSCLSVHGTPSLDEDPLISSGRMACLQEGERRRQECLTPMQLSNCP